MNQRSNNDSLFYKNAELCSLNCVDKFMLRVPMGYPNPGFSVYTVLSVHCLLIKYAFFAKND